MGTADALGEWMLPAHAHRRGDGTTTGTSARAGGADPADRRRLSVFHLVGLAAGGVIGSGWISGASKAYAAAGSWAWAAWLTGGLLMFLIGWVMVELARDAPKTGGLIFLPLQSSGPLVATLLAAGLWIFYAINLASESIMMTNGLSTRAGLFHNNQQPTPAHETLTWAGWPIVLLCMIAISALNLLVPRIFFRVNSWLTVLKIAILVAAAVLLLGHISAPAPSAGDEPGPGTWTSMLTAVIDSGVIYAYIGFQGPLDFAGNIKRSASRWRRAARRGSARDDAGRQGAREASRLRWAVLGTLVGSVVLYGALQFAFVRYAGSVGPHSPDAPYTQIAFAGHDPALAWALRVAGVAAPMGAALVFAHALTREVAALGRAHLTHRGLQTARRTTVAGHHGIYWLVLVVDLCVGVAMLGVARGSWSTLGAITGVLALIVYGMQGVVLVSLENRLARRSRWRRRVQGVLARVSFALIGLVLYVTGWPDVWRGMATLAGGGVLLLGLPLVSRRWPRFGRFYDAKAHALKFRGWRGRAAAQETWAARAALVLLGYLAALTLLTLWGNISPPTPARHGHVSVVLGCVVVVVAAGAFEALVHTSRRYLAATDAAGGIAAEPDGGTLPVPATAVD
jgi:amino acid transporter